MSNQIKLEIDIDTLSPSKAAVLSQLFNGLAGCQNETKPQPKSDLVIEDLGKLLNETMQVVRTQDEPAEEAPAPKRRASRAKVNTETTSTAFADKERTESLVDEYEAAKDIETEAEEIVPDSSILEAGNNTVGATDITLDMLQSAMTLDIIDNHRAALKAKVAELGAAKLALLDKSKYAEMLAFLKGLK